MIDIEIYIDSFDNILNNSYTQYMLNYLTNSNSENTNTLYYNNDISYIIYNYDDPSAVISDTKIYIKNIQFNTRYI